MKKISVFCLLFFLSVSGSFATTLDSKFVKKRLGPYVGTVESFVYWNNFNSFAFVINKGKGKYTIIKNGSPILGYLSAQDPVYSPDGKHFAFVAQKYNQKYVVIRDSVESKEYDLPPDGLVFSPDSIHFAYSFWKWEWLAAMIDEVETQSFGGISGTVSFSSDGKSYAIGAIGDNGVSYIIQDGKVINRGQYRELRNPVYSSTWSRFAYTALKSDGKYVLIENNIESNEYDEIFVPSLFSPDGKKLSFIAAKSGKWMVVTDRKEGKQYDSSTENFYTSINQLVYYPDSKETMYIAYQWWKSILVKNNVEITKYVSLNSPRYLSDDGTSFMFIAEKSKGTWVVVKDNTEIPTYLGSSLLTSLYDHAVISIAHSSRPWKYVVAEGSLKSSQSYDKIDLLSSAWSKNSMSFAFLSTLGNKNYINIWTKKVK